jgi:DNA recombination protein RmuC
MDPTTTALGLFGLGLACGALGASAVWAIAGSRQRRVLPELEAVKARLEERSARVERLEADLDEREQRLAESRAAVQGLREAEVGLKAEIEGERKAAAEKLALLGEAETKLREAFQSLSAEALRQNNQSFLELAKTSLGEHQKAAASDLESRKIAIEELVKPVRESLGKVDEKLQQVEKERAVHHTSITEQVKALAAAQQELRGETASLARALRAPNVRGRWGEIQLRRVVELAGMLEHCDFHEQRTIETESGRLRPDLIVQLPGAKNIVVDAKAPLTAYLEALDAKDEGEARNHLRAHAKQVREHVAKLSSRDYWSQFQSSPEFVVMFLPGETFFSAALEHDAALIEFGIEKCVIPASPTTLIALLRAVASGWRQERLAENAQKISELGNELYRRVCTMAGHFAELRRGLDKALEAYNRTAASLDTRVLTAARKFRDLDAGTKEEVPFVDAIDRAPRALQAADFLELEAPVVPVAESS